MPAFGYVRVPHFERISFNKEEMKEKMGVDKLFIDWITAVKAEIIPNFYDMLQKTTPDTKIVIKSIENLGFSNGSLCALVEDLRARNVTLYSYEDEVILTGDDQYKMLKGTQSVAKANQMKGIKKAMAKGVKFGREIQYATDEKKLNRVMLDYDRQAISWREAADKLGIEKKTTFFYRYHKWEKDTGRK